MFVNKCVYNEIKKTAVYCLTHLPGKHSKMDYDAVLAEIGEFGAWQQGIIVLLWLPPMFAGIHNLLFVFTGNSVWATCLVKNQCFLFSGLSPKNGFRCQIPECDTEEFEFSDFPDSLFPLDNKGNPDYCKFYQPRFTDGNNKTCSRTEFDTSSVVDCSHNTKFAFSDFEFKETLVTKWGNVCGKEVFISFLQFIYIF